MFVLNTSERLPATKKLWIDDPYLTSCSAKILHVQDNLVVTDRTVFYAESGGQVADRGWIDGNLVVDVQKQPGQVLHLTHPDVTVPSVQVNTVVVHVLEEPAPLSIGQEVEMSIDWPLRYLHMRYHSASHFLYHAVEKIYSSEGKKPYTKGCYIHSKSARFDYGAKFDPALIPQVSALANELIALGKDIVMEPDPNTKEVSYWRYDNIIIPCGGTHVKNATEIGSIRVKRKSHGKNTERIYAYLEDVAS